MGYMYAVAEAPTQYQAPDPTADGIAMVLQRDAVAQRAWGGGIVLEDGDITDLNGQKLTGSIPTLLLDSPIETALIADDSLTNPKYQALSITGGKMANGTVGNTQLGNLSVSDAKVSDVAASKVGTGYPGSSVSGAVANATNAAAVPGAGITGDIFSSQMQTNVATAVNSGANTVNASKVGTGYPGSSVSGAVANANAVPGSGITGDIFTSQMTANAPAAVNANATTTVNASKIGTGYPGASVSGAVSDATTAANMAATGLSGDVAAARMQTNVPTAVNNNTTTAINASKIGSGYPGASVSGTVANATTAAAMAATGLSGDIATARMQVNAAAAVNAGTTDINATQVAAGYDSAGLTGNVPTAQMQTNVVAAINAQASTITATKVAAGYPVGSLASVTVAAADLNKTAVAAWAAGATNNPQTAGPGTASSVGAQTITSTASPGADQAATQTAVDNLRTAVNDVIARFNSLIGASILGNSGAKVLS